MKTKRRIQVAVVSLAVGDADGKLVEQPIIFDKKYARAIAVAAIERTASGIDYQLGVLTPRDTPVDLCASEILRTSTNVGSDNKFFSLGTNGEGIPVVDNEEVKVQIKNVNGTVVPAGGVTVEFIFILEKDLQ